MLTVDGLCGELRDWDNDDEDYEVSSACTFEEDSVFNAFKLLADEGWRGPRFVAVSQDGAWSVSLLQTVLQAAAPFTTDVVTLAGVVEYVRGGDRCRRRRLLPGGDLVPRGRAAAAPHRHLDRSGTVGTARWRSSASVPAPPSASTSAATSRSASSPFSTRTPADFVGTFQCDEQSEPIAAPATMLLTTSAEMAFSSIEQLGDVTVTVS